MMLGQPTQTAQQAIPDAPRPQVSLPTGDSVKPGMGTTPTSNCDATPSDDDKVPSSLPSNPQTQQKPTEQEAEVPSSGQGPAAFTLHVQTNFVEVPFTVKDNKGKEV